MVLKFLRGITANIQKVKFFTILADKSMDAGNKEQLNIVFLWVDEMLLVHEDFVGLHEIDDASVAGDTIEKCTVLKKALDITYEMTKLIKYSPKRDAMFNKLKDELQPECPGIRVLCPTRWTV